jgi:hypothetical protein
MKEDPDQNSTDSAEIEALITRIERGQLRDGNAQLLARGFFRTEVRGDRLSRNFFNLLESSFKTRPTSEGG